MLLWKWKSGLVTQHNLYSCRVVYYYTKSWEISQKGKVLIRESLCCFGTGSPGWSLSITYIAAVSCITIQNYGNSMERRNFKRESYFDLELEVWVSESA